MIFLPKKKKKQCTFYIIYTAHWDTQMKVQRKIFLVYPSFSNVMLIFWNIQGKVYMINLSAYLTQFLHII